MNRQEAAKLVAVILASCPTQASKLDAARQIGMVDAFESLLGDLTYTQANAAVAVLLQTRPFMPAVADIRATALEIERGAVAPGGEQWGTVLRCVSKYGYYRQPGVDFIFQDAVTAKCVQALGWRELCLSENSVADRARFVELYDKLAAQSQREAQSPVLGAVKAQRELASGAQSVVLSLAGSLSRREEDVS